MSEERKGAVIETGYLPRGPWYDSFHTELPRMRSSDVLSIPGVLLDAILKPDLPPPEDDIEKLLQWFWWFCIDYLADLGRGGHQSDGIYRCKLFLRCYSRVKFKRGLRRKHFH
ncbi:hypothetical protein F5Y06DRAFT_277010 [Hypoxylon sp. FL0890]|nr:hypothetical protein F5Y06DRAFT_277010 [Hypoxylon sp. FL0890]